MTVTSIIVLIIFTLEIRLRYYKNDLNNIQSLSTPETGANDINTVFESELSGSFADNWRKNGLELARFTSSLASKYKSEFAMSDPIKEMNYQERKSFINQQCRKYYPSYKEAYCNQEFSSQGNNKNRNHFDINTYRPFMPVYCGPDSNLNPKTNKISKGLNKTLRTRPWLPYNILTDKNRKMLICMPEKSGCTTYQRFYQSITELPMFRGFQEHEQNMNMNIIHVQNHVLEHDFSEHMFSHVLNMMFQIMFLNMIFWNMCSATFKNICF